MSAEQAAEQTEGRSSLAEIFHGLIEEWIDENGLEDPMGVALLADVGLEVFSLMTKPEDAVKWMLCTAATRPDIVEIMLGIDRFTKEGQGTEFASVIAGPHWRRQEDGKGTVQGYTIDYDFGPPKIVRPVSYDNEFWGRAITEECNSVVASIAWELQARGRAAR